jgi:hypothetical protein
MAPESAAGYPAANQRLNDTTSHDANKKGGGRRPPPVHVGPNQGDGGTPVALPTPMRRRSVRVRKKGGGTSATAQSANQQISKSTQRPPV